MLAKDQLLELITTINSKATQHILAVLVEAVSASEERISDLEDALDTAVSMHIERVQDIEARLDAEFGEEEEEDDEDKEDLK